MLWKNREKIPQVTNFLSIALSNARVLKSKSRGTRNHSVSHLNTFYSVIQVERVGLTHFTHGDFFIVFLTSESSFGCFA